MAEQETEQTTERKAPRKPQRRTEQRPVPRLKVRYREEIRPTLQRELDLSNLMQVPGLEKIGYAPSQKTSDCMVSLALYPRTVTLFFYWGAELTDPAGRLQGSGNQVRSIPLSGRVRKELAAHLLSPLDHEPELLDTLQVFFAQNCCPSETARRLVIHRNTLTYRLQKVALLTGLDPRRFDDATQIHLALLLRSFGASASQAEVRH